METADVVIVGAGVAGLFTALNLGKNFKVIIIEKDAFPADKLCGGLMCEEAYGFIKELDPPQSIFYSPATLQTRVSDLDNHLAFTPEHTFHNLKRTGFYSWLKTLLGDNVCIKDRVKPKKITADNKRFTLTVIDHEKREWEIRTGFLIGADGVNSFVRRCFFTGRPGYIHSVQYTVKDCTPVSEALFIFDATLCKDYYSWIIPRDNGIVAGTRIEGKNYLHLQDRIAKEYKIQGNWFTKKSCPITKINSIEELVLGKGQLLLAGEAAGFVRPSSGEGLTLALQSALYAAQAIQTNPDNTIEEYRKLCSRQFPLLSQDIKTAQIIFNPGKRKSYFTGAR